jgi:hypothetical protein
VYADGRARPVAGILGLLELLYGTRDKLNEEQVDYIRQIFGTLNSQREYRVLPLSIAVTNDSFSARDPRHF